MEREAEGEKGRDGERGRVRLARKPMGCKDRIENKSYRGQGSSSV